MERGRRNPSGRPASASRNRPPSRAPAGKKQPSPQAPTSWVLLDNIVYRSHHEDAVVDEATASSISHDCVGRPIRASVRVADAPAASRLYIHWKGSPREMEIATWPPSVISAHRGAILFKVTVPFENPSTWNRWHSGRFPVDYFVYSASSSPPALTRLPPCFLGGLPEPKLATVKAEISLAKKLWPYTCMKQRLMLPNRLGLLCHGDNGAFTVATLSFHDGSPELCWLHHPTPAEASSTRGPQWKVQKLPLPPGCNFSRWRVDTVFPIDDRFLCWFDYYHGMLILDVVCPLTERELFFISLPAPAMQSRRMESDVLSPDALRCACFTCHGHIKLVCIDTIKRSSLAFTITIWSLRDIRQGNWHRDATMEGAEFFATLPNSLPRAQPSFPMVNLANPNVIYFLLEENNIFWTVEVNMFDRVMKSSALYIKKEDEEEEEGHFSARKFSKTLHDLLYFIPSNFTSYLSKDAITSRKLSEKMQEKAVRKLSEKMQEKAVRKLSEKMEEKAKQQKSGLTESAELERFTGLKVSEDHA